MVPLLLRPRIELDRAEFSVSFGAVGVDWLVLALKL